MRMQCTGCLLLAALIGSCVHDKQLGRSESSRQVLKARPGCDDSTCAASNVELTATWSARGKGFEEGPEALRWRIERGEFGKDVTKISLSGVVGVDRYLEVLIERATPVSLDLSYSDATDETLDWLVRTTPGLESLELSGCAQITADGIRSLAGLRRVRHLGLSFCDLPVSSVAALRLCPIDSLGAPSGFGDKDIATLQGVFPGLVKLQAWDSALTSVGVGQLGGFRSLRQLELSVTSSLSEDAGSSLSSLVALAIYSFAEQSGFIQAVSRLPLLRSLRVDCAVLDPQAAEDLLVMKGLCCLRLVDVVGIGDAVLRCSDLPRVVEFELIGVQIHGQGLAALHNMPALKEFVFSSPVASELALDEIESLSSRVDVRCFGGGVVTEQALRERSGAEGQRLVFLGYRH